MCPLEFISGDVNVKCDAACMGLANMEYLSRLPHGLYVAIVEAFWVP